MANHDDRTRRLITNSEFESGAIPTLTADDPTAGVDLEVFAAGSGNHPPMVDSTVKIPFLFEDSSDGIPVVANDDADAHFSIPQSVPISIEAPEPTSQLMPMSMSQKFALLWAVETGARYAKKREPKYENVDCEVDQMPEHDPIGVHLWSRDFKAFAGWLSDQEKVGFRDIPYQQALPDEVLPTAAAILKGIVFKLKARIGVISIGPTEFVYLPFR